MIQIPYGSNIDSQWFMHNDLKWVAYYTSIENAMIFANAFRRSICDLDFHNTRLFPAKQCDSAGNRGDTHNVMSSKAFD